MVAPNEKEQLLLFLDENGYTDLYEKLIEELSQVESGRLQKFYTLKRRKQFGDKEYPPLRREIGKLPTR